MSEENRDLSRRLFVASASLAAAGTAAVPAWDALAEVRKYRKIDSHNHVFLSPRQTPRAVVEAADRLSIERLVVSLPRGDTPEGFRAANDTVLKAMKEYPDRLLGQCFLNPAYPREAMDEMSRCMDLGMVGLGELYTQVKINDQLYYPFIEKSIEMKAPILMHARADLGLLRPGHRTEAPPTTSVASDFVEAARRYPEAILIHGHIGGGGDWEYMCKTLRDCPTVYIDTSGSVSDEGMIDFALRYLGPERLLFATDLNFESGVGKILAANLTEQQRRMIFFDNYNSILRKRGLHAR
jgi:predicted TIM-barrel fold metal-dependent hydrolase